jgi:hypothetical protein
MDKYDKFKQSISNIDIRIDIEKSLILFSDLQIGDVISHVISCLKEIEKDIKQETCESIEESLNIYYEKLKILNDVFIDKIIKLSSIKKEFKEYIREELLDLNIDIEGIKKQIESIVICNNCLVNAIEKKFNENDY